ncbi:MAG: hypothetical protein QM692_22735 [Thermomicrobiales bacterium]
MQLKKGGLLVQASGNTTESDQDANYEVEACVDPAIDRQSMRPDARQEELIHLIEELRAVFRDVPADELERETAKAVAEVKAEMRAEREAALTQHQAED